MSYALSMRFAGVTEDDYWAVNAHLGIHRDGSGDWPAGLLAHAGGPTANGWAVIERWESKAAHAAFMDGRLGAALAAVGVPAPVDVIETELINDRVFA